MDWWMNAIASDVFHVFLFETNKLICFCGFFFAHRSAQLFNHLNVSCHVDQKKKKQIWNEQIAIWTTLVFSKGWNIIRHCHSNKRSRWDAPAAFYRRPYWTATSRKAVLAVVFQVDGIPIRMRKTGASKDWTIIDEMNFIMTETTVKRKRGSRRQREPTRMREANRNESNHFQKCRRNTPTHTYTQSQPDPQRKEDEGKMHANAIMTDPRHRQTSSGGRWYSIFVLE